MSYYVKFIREVGIFLKVTFTFTFIFGASSRLPKSESKSES